MDVPWLSVEELAAQIANGSGMQIVDARPREHMALNVDLMAGATWRDQAGAAGPEESTCTSPPLAIRGSRWNRATCRGWCGRPCATTIARTT